MKVLFVCSGGMSSAIVEDALTKEAKKRKVDLEAKAVGTGAFESEVHEGWDIALVAPQVKHRFKTFEEAAKHANVPIMLIAPMNYTPLGGPALLDEILKKLN